MLVASKALRQRIRDSEVSSRNFFTFSAEALALAWRTDTKSCDREADGKWRTKIRMKNEQRQWKDIERRERKREGERKKERETERQRDRERERKRERERERKREREREIDR